MGQCEHSGVVHPSPTPSLEGRGLRAVAGEVQFFSDRGENAVGVLQHVVVPEADYAVAVGFDDFGAPSIGEIVGVLAAVEFHSEPGRAASEIDDKIADWALPVELRPAQLTGAEVRPEAPFCVGHVASQFARDAGQSFSYQRRTPIPNPFPEGKGLFSLSHKARNAQTH